MSVAHGRGLFHLLNIDEEHCVSPAAANARLDLVVHHPTNDIVNDLTVWTTTGGRVYRPDMSLLLAIAANRVRVPPTPFLGGFFLRRFPANLRFAGMRNCLTRRRKMIPVDELASRRTGECAQIRLRRRAHGRGADSNC